MSRYDLSTLAVVFGPHSDFCLVFADGVKLTLAAIFRLLISFHFFSGSIKAKDQHPNNDAHACV